VSSLPKTVARQRRGCDLNPGPSALESSTLTTRLPSHRMDRSRYRLGQTHLGRLTQPRIRCESCIDPPLNRALWRRACSTPLQSSWLLFKGGCVRAMRPFVLISLDSCYNDGIQVPVLVYGCKSWSTRKQTSICAFGLTQLTV